MIVFTQSFQENNEDNNGAQATDPQISANNQDIIPGGWYAEELGKVSNTVEKCSIVEGTSQQ